jgi:hypothetical protein
MSMSRLKVYIFTPKRQVDARRIFVHPRTRSEQLLGIVRFYVGEPVRANVRGEDATTLKICRVECVDEQIEINKSDFIVS